MAAGAPFTSVVNVMGLLFMSLSNLGSINIQSVLIVAAQERTVSRQQGASIALPCLADCRALLVVPKQCTHA